MIIFNKIAERIKGTKDLPIALKAAIWFSICGFLQKGAAFLTMPIFTRLLTTEEFGIVTIYNSWVSILTIIITLNVFYGAFNTAMIEFDERRDSYTSSLLGMMLCSTILFLVLFALTPSYFTYLTGISGFLTILAIIQVYFQGIVSLWFSRQKFDYKYRLVIAVTVLMYVIAPVVSVIFILIFPLKAEAKIVGALVVDILLAFYLAFDLIKKGKVVFSNYYWKYALRFNGPLVLHYLASSVLGQSDRIMIDKYIGKSAAAIYAVSYSLSTALTIITTSINQAIVPWLYRKLKDNKIQDTENVIYAAITIVAYSLALFMLWGPELIRIVATDAYYEAVWVIPPLTYSIYFTFLYQLFANFEFYFKKIKYIVIASLTATIFNIVLNLYFIPKFGFIAAGYTTLFCYLIFGFAHMCCAKYVLNKHKISWPYNIKNIVVISSLPTIWIVISNILYDKNTVRYIFIIITVFLGIYIKKQIKLLKGLK